ncbi:Serine/threonine-protein kinase cek1 [Diplogelasinospora grovesii]|uniref:non-specific serine/threonine protein kinase n=1 Tax=Diplogelasinospora grovesii TaxID=303347 RepID=A0AAN6N2W7_9PEZI|nr:Serine/threonine-protein kinase cek1 [Diplogelasinospora grovesii]
MEEGTATPNTLAPPAVMSLRAGGMERSLSEDIREEREELREAAEQTLNVIMDLNLDGTIRWVSPSWVDVIGTQPDSVTGTAISDIVVSEPTSIFTDIVESMKKDDSRSQFIRFAVQLGPLSKLLPLEFVKEPEEASQPAIVDLEAQGIMVYDGASGGESHTMWMIRPWMAPREIKIDLPALIVDSLGSGAEILASHLTQLAESGLDDPANHPPPLPVLCRICERQIPPWWFEKHTDLCLQEHRAEMEVQMAQESLTEHRHAIVKVLDALEARRSRSLTGDQTPLPVAEYKGMPIGPPPSSGSSPSTSSPSPKPAASSSSGQSRERSGFGHSRARSFAIRRPQARIVELLLDLCDTAIEISTPAIKETSQVPGEFRTQSPQSEGRIAQVMQWETPGTNTLEQEQGLALLCADTEKVAKAKVEAVFRHRKILEYAERIRIEFAYMVEECIAEAMHKAAQIAAGRLSDSADEDGDEAEEDTATMELEEGIFTGSFDAPSTLAAALQKANISDDPDKRRLSTAIDSTRSSSPRECPTPRSNRGAHSSLAAGPSQSRRESLFFESDAGDSDGSMRSSSVASRQPPPRTESPISEFGDLRRQASSRQHHRRSLILPGTISPRRQESPSRTGQQQPSSPLRIHKPRNLPFPSDGLISPESSPMLPGSEFTSPNLPHHIHSHHRRQSSAAISASTGEMSFSKPPPSPRLSAVVSAPQARAVPPSIKDFEIIKPISKGAFGSVYLSKKKSTGEYFAIKVLKKADMVAKNQVTNVKAERAIMMWQGESDFVAKLYWTFSSKDYLYLVMEYLNGGDCASLIKVLGGLPEDWGKKYLGEVILGVEHLHSRGIVHRDLKPDNLLIDQKGHLKLTDFGLSRMGLIGRQKRALNSGADAAPDLLKQGPFARSTSMASSRSTSLDLHGRHSPTSDAQMTPSDPAASFGQPSYFNLGSLSEEPRRVSGHRSDSGGSEALTQMLGNFSLNDTQPSVSSSHSQAVQSPAEGSEADGGASPDLSALSHATTQTSVMTDSSRGTPPQPAMPPPNWALFDPEDTNRRFVGTPDYLAPETIRGEPQDETSDWWSVGCIMFEFLYGYPPFHAGEAERVFENILARRIQWPDESEDEVSPEAKDLMNKLLCSDPQQRLGSNREEKFKCGGEEIRNHPWFQGLNWETLLQDEAQFVPQPENPEDTEYFDSRGATLQSFAEEIEDQLTSPAASTPASDYQERPHDALSRVRSQVNSMKRGLMPLHIPPHVRDLKSRRLSEPVPTDDFGNFAFKNLPVLEKANKDVIQKLRAEALAVQNKPLSPGGMNGVTSPGLGPTLEGSPVLSMPVQRTLSNAKASQRPQSPSGLSHSNSSPSRVSQPSSPLLVSFVAGQGTEGRRKASSNSSSLSQQSGANLQPGTFFDVPRVPPSLQKAATTVAAVSPVKGRGAPPPPLPLSPQKVVTNQVMTSTPRHASGSSGGRSRSLTVGSQEGSPVASDILAAHHRNRRSQVFDMSPSSSDNEGDKANALLRVQRRRQSSRRMSQIALDGPTFRSLDVLICEDHPVSRMVMEKLLEKLRCRTISAPTGSEAVRYSMSEIKFDIIFMEFKLPQINGADVARMIRETKNTNSHTPIVAITAYLKELQAPHYFDSLIEKPISSSKLTEVLGTLCQWKPPSPSQMNSLSLSLPHPIPSGLRQESLRLEDSPTSGSSGYAHRSSSSFREDSISSSLFGDSESVSTDDIPVVISRKATGDWDEGGLGISGQEEMLLSSSDPLKSPIRGHLVTQQSAPGQMEHSPGRAKMPQPQRSLEKLRAKRESIEKRRLEGSVDSADDEDDELGQSSSSGSGGSPKQHYRSKSVLPSSKLGIEMMRANSHDSVTLASSESTSTSTSTAEPTTQVVTPNREMQMDFPGFATTPDPMTPPPLPLPQADEEEADATVIICTPPVDDDKSSFDVDETPRPTSAQERRDAVADEEPTPRAPIKTSADRRMAMS